MAETFSLAVWCAEPTARFDTRKFHFLRRDALHDALDHCECIRVLDWGRTDDKYKHEIIDLVIEANSAGAAVAAGVPALAYVARILAKNHATAACITAATAIIERLAPKQAAGEIDAVHLHLLNNTVLILHPAGQVAMEMILQMIAPDGRITDIPYEATEAEISGL